MANPLYQSMQPQSSNMMQMLQNLKQNPVQFLMQRKFNVPQNVQNDPNAIIKHLMDTGQVSQSDYDRAMQMAQQFKR